MSAAIQMKLLPFEVEVTSGPHLGQKFTFVDTVTITIGRGAENQISLNHDPRISRVHAEIKQENENFYVYNRTDKNFILVNGQKEDQFKITQSCTITIGDSELRFIYPLPPKSIKSPLQPLVPSPAAQQILALHQLPAQPQAQPQVARRRRPVKQPEKFNPMILVLIAAVVIVLIFVLPNKPKNDGPVDRVPEIITPVLQDEQRLKEAMDRAKEALAKMENQNSRQVMAQQFFISGMREFLNGNYHRSVSFLNSAYQSDPTLIDAEKFAREAQRKLDRLIDFYFSEGLKYRESSNYRMCKSSFQTVQLYVRNNLKHPRYIEAKQFYDECSNLDRVRRF